MKDKEKSPQEEIPQEARNEETPVENSDAQATAEKDEKNASGDGWTKAGEKQPEEKKEPTAEEKLAALANQYLYVQAEYQNYRKRVAKDIADARQNAIADTLTPFLTVFDYLSMADNAAVKSDNVESIRQGLKMIIDQFFHAFEEIGVQPVESVNRKFDPQLHDAVAKEFSETVPEGTVIREWNRAFKLGDKLLRPARVVVSSGAPKTEETASPDEDAAKSQTDDGAAAPEKTEAK